MNFRHDLAGWWVAAALAAGAVLVPALAAAARTITRSARPRALAAMSTDDVFDDLAAVFAFPVLKRLELPSHPWRFAVLVAAVAAAPVALGGAVDGDPFDGLVRAATEVAAVLGCYATLCRPLGLIRRDV